ncbi:riboflavin kinase [Candidatus Peregrinibacteria bacterium]|nr:MAG: riboflavin kinase [Candidatus Peregrinibacteria bacterium]
MQLIGEIVHGAGRGAAMGFPTLNVEGNFSGLEHGVYAVWVTLKKGRFKGAMSFGPQPTFKDAQVRVEVFLLDFEGEVYGEQATVEVVKKIRELQTFESVEALKLHIQKDVEKVRSVLDLF